MSEFTRAARQAALDQAKAAAGDSWSAADEAIFNAYWEEKELDKQVAQFLPPEQKSTEEPRQFGLNDQNQVTLNGKPVSELKEDDLRGAYGEAGDIGLVEGQTFDFSAGNKPPRNFDPRYWETYDINLGDAGTTTGYRLKPEYERMQGMAQVGVPRSVGGPGEPIDPTAVTYDPEFGYITPITNIQAPEESFINRALPFVLAAGGLAAIGAVGGLSGLGISGAGGAGAGGAGAGGAGAGGGGIVGGAGAGAGAGGVGLGQYAGMATGLDGLSAASLTAGGGAANIGATTAGLTGAGTGSSFLGSIGSAIGGAADWFSGLSPMAQRAITSAISTGASGILANQRQQSAQDFARQQQERQSQERLAEEERMRREREVRGTPTAMQFNITPRPGIIGSRIGG